MPSKPLSTRYSFKEQVAMKEIYESAILTEYLLVHDKNFEMVRNFRAPMVKRAVAWKLAQSQIHS